MPMRPVGLGEALEHALDSLLADRLALLIGAGLSMAPPSSLPSAATIAAVAKQKYDARYGATRPPLAAGIEEQAEFFFQRGQLEIYFRSYVDQDLFAGPPNPGHLAVADFLIVRAIQTAVTTNVDALIETAGNLLRGQVEVGIDGLGLAALPPDAAPLLKIHGCRVCDCANMVWAPGQITAPPVANRIASSSAWLRPRLVNRDLLIVGYWTDWDYLNDVLATTLGDIQVSRVIVVDLADPATFEAKAPDLYALGNRAGVSFSHLRESGATFLDELRREFGRAYVRGVLYSGRAEFAQQSGADPQAVWLEPPTMDNDTLWQVRRDLEGRLPGEPAKDRRAPAEHLLGLTLLQLRAAGATPDGSYWQIGGRRIRVLRAVNKALHTVEAEFQREIAPAIAPDLIIAVGAEESVLPVSIARAKTKPTIARGGGALWLTRPEAVQELHL